MSCCGAQQPEPCGPSPVLVLTAAIPLPGTRLGFTIDNGKIHNVSLGQGQEVVAEHAMEVAAAEGHWVILQVGGGSGAHHSVLSPGGNRAHQGTEFCQHPGTLCMVTPLAMAVTLPGPAGCNQHKHGHVVPHLPLWSRSRNRGWDQRGK